MTDKWNPRYVTYAAEHGETPESMLERDKKEYPGGRMTGFIIWISRRWSEWDALNPGRKMHCQPEQDDFNAWLDERRESTEKRA